MVRMAIGVAAWCLMAPAPGFAQVHDGIDNSPSQQRVADELRAAGSKCTAPACGNNADGVYPPSTRPGEGAKTPSISAGHSQPDD